MSRAALEVLRYGGVYTWTREPRTGRRYTLRGAFRGISRPRS